MGRHYIALHAGGVGRGFRGVNFPSFGGYDPLLAPKEDGRNISRRGAEIAGGG